MYLINFFLYMLQFLLWMYVCMHEAYVAVSVFVRTITDKLYGPKPSP